MRDACKACRIECKAWDGSSVRYVYCPAAGSIPVEKAMACKLHIDGF